MKSRFLSWLVAALLASSASLQAVAIMLDEATAGEKWVKTNVLGAEVPLPFSFTFDGKPSRDILRSWKRLKVQSVSGGPYTKHTRIWMDPASGLEVRWVVVEYGESPVVEWTLYLKNRGQKKTPIIENIQGMDMAFERSREGEFVLHGNRGDSCVAESYAPYDVTLGPGKVKRCSPPVDGENVSGKSCDGPDGWPYYNVQMPGGGVILAVGWPGQWETSFIRDDGRTLRVKTGQQLTHLSLNPGEEIRTPSTTLLFWQGTDVVRAQNLWRRWYLGFVLPGGREWPVLSIQAEGSLAAYPHVEAYLQAGVKPDVCWRDAGGRGTWYPSKGGPYTDNMAWLNTGTWEPDPERFPSGFKPFSDKVHSQGMQFLLWFEPERVGDPNSWLGKNHPEWLLPGNSAGSLLNLGDPQAWKWLVDHVDGLVKSQGLDWYREDMNGGNYGTAWRKHDAPDRQGMTENLYVQGHLKYWDELLRRNPGLRIDSCASGGRRNDLETMRRAVPLLRSDFQHSSMKGVIEGNQGHTYGISSWLPWNGSGVYFTDSYAVRSFLLPGFDVIPPGDWEKSEPARAAVERAYDEARRVAPLMFGDYYPLTPYSIAADRWMGWQFNRGDKGDGVVQAFRRGAAKEETLRVKLSGLDPSARYEVENLDGGKETHTGRELMEDFVMTLKTAPAAAVFIYSKLGI